MKFLYLTKLSPFQENIIKDLVPLSQTPLLVMF